MCRIASLFLLQRPRGSMSGDARNSNNIETQAVIKFIFLQGEVPKKIHAIDRNTRGTCTIHCMPPSKTGWPGLNMVIFPPVMRLILDDPKQ